MTPTLSVPQIEKRLMELIAGFSPRPDAVTRDATLEALDVDSLDLVEFAQAAEEEFGVTLVTDDVQEVKTVGEALDLVVGLALP